MKDGDIMQFLEIAKNATLSWLNARVGSKNVSTVLQQNNVPRVHKIGEAFNNMYHQKAESYTEVDADGVVHTEVTYPKKINVLNTLTSDADVFEAAALQSPDGWKLLATVGTMPNYLRMPSTIVLPDSVDVLGGGNNNNAVTKRVYSQAIGYLENKLDVDPAIFNTYSDIRSATYNTVGSDNVYQWFKLPWGDITLYSSLSDTSMDFPVYPEEYEDEYHANYDTMPDLLYQYEPWQVYKSSGPRSNSYTFKMHRDMWSGDHRDGKCNELIRFCQANCFPVYNGATVNTATVVLYIAGKPLIRGILTSVKTQYSGPIGLDGFPLYVEMTLNITEVSSEPLNYYSVMMKGLIG